MFREESVPFQVPLEAYFHVTIPVKYVPTYDEFVSLYASSYRVDLPNIILKSPCSLGWSEDGIYIGLDLLHNGPYSPKWPKYTSGDAIEVFIDTKNMQNFRLLHRFCHQFVIFPDAIEGITSKEVTQFRSQETRNLAADNSLKVKCLDISRRKKNRSLIIFIPQEVLFGWDGEEVPVFGFGYTIYTAASSSLSFPLSSNRSSTRISLLEKFPHRWATCTAIKE